MLDFQFLMVGGEPPKTTEIDNQPAEIHQVVVISKLNNRHVK